MEIDEKLIASCGMNCWICRAYLRQNNPCHGCNYAEKNWPKTRVKCRLRVCKKRKGNFCYDCVDFPCDRLKHLDNRYRTRYGMSEIENLKYIRDKGIKKFLEKERKKWISKTGVLCVHDKKYYKKTNMSREVNNYIEKQKSPQREICQKLRKIIIKTFPNIKEKMWVGVPWYEGRYYIVALKDHVNLGFAIKGLSKRELELFEGQGKTMRHIKIYSAEDINEKEVVKLLKVAKKAKCSC